MSARRPFFSAISANEPLVAANVRPLLALLTSVLILGGLQGYFVLRDRLGPAAAETLERPAPGLFTLEIVLTFDAGPDPFALDAADKTCLEVSFRGAPLLRRAERVTAGERVVVSPVPGLVAGEDEFSGSNEFLIKATPEVAGAESAQAARVRLLRDGAVVAETSLWSDASGKVEGKLVAVVVETDSRAAQEERRP